MANIRTAMNRGAFDFLTKPIDFADLETTIDKTLRHVEMLREARRRQTGGGAGARARCRAISRPIWPSGWPSDPGAVDLGGQRREVTSLFTDMADLRRSSRRSSPTRIAPLLNDYLGEMTDIVFAHGGTVVKIVGDALHVLFGAPGRQPDHASRAVACALELDARSQVVPSSAGAKQRGGPRPDPDWRSMPVRRLSAISAAGGISTTPPMATRMNIAARLETANKQLGTRICVGESVAARVPDFTGRPVGDLMLRGRSERLRAFEPLSRRGRMTSARPGPTSTPSRSSKPGTRAATGLRRACSVCAATTSW